MWCDCCGDIVKASYPIKIVFPDKSELELNVCLECYDSNETLEIDVKRKHEIAKAMVLFNKDVRNLY